MTRLSNLKNIIHQLRSSKVLENYSYMTALQIVSALIGFIIYPIVIRRLGAEQYGLYAFTLSIVLYFQIVIDGGFSFPAVKAVSENRDNPQRLSEIASTVFAAKSALFVLMVAAAALVVYCIPLLRTHWLLFGVIFIQNSIDILFPQWYFQGMKQMKVPSIINLICRLLQIPLVIWLIHDESDLVVYAAIVSGTMLMGALYALIYMLTHGIRLHIPNWQQLKSLCQDGFPFFLTDLAGNIKERVLTNLIGVYLGMREVAIYDLATKVVQIPRLFTQSINKAIFPEIVVKATKERIQKILHYERGIGIAMSLAVIAVGYWIIWILGGKNMLDAYPLAAILSLSIYTWLVTGAYLQFVFISSERYSLVTWNQVVALISCLLLCIIGLYAGYGVYAVVIALVISGFAEIGFCRIVCKKKELL